MAKLVWQPPGQPSTAFAIRQERVAVGRDASNDIRLPEPAVSARHAVIITRGGQSTLHDLNSSNGSWINGKRVESQQLHHGDTVQIGRLAMNFIDESSAADPQARVGSTQRDATVSIRNQSPPAIDPLATSSFPAQAVQLPPGAPDMGELDRLIGSIRSHRSSESQQQEQKRAVVQEEWQKVMTYCTALKARLASEPRVRFFEVSERHGAVVIRVSKQEGDPVQSIRVTHGRGSHRAGHQDGIWLLEPQQPERRFETCAETTRHLVTAIAHLLA